MGSKKDFVLLHAKEIVAEFPLSVVEKIGKDRVSKTKTKRSKIGQKLCERDCFLLELVQYSSKIVLSERINALSLVTEEVKELYKQKYLANSTLLIKDLQGKVFISITVFV